MLRAQAVSVPVNPRSTADELARMIADSGSRLVVADEEALPAVRAAVATVTAALDGDASLLDADLVSRAVRPRVVAVGADRGAGELAFDDLLSGESRPVPPLQDPDKLAALLYTSGTSGRPRAAMLTHRALIANIEQVARVEPKMIHGDDVVLGVLPLFHVYGLNAVLGGVLRERAKLLLVERWDPIAVLDLVEDEACSVLPVAPPAFAHWLPLDNLADRLGPVRLVLSGSAPLAPDVVDAFTDATAIPVHQGYGLTEAAPVVTSTLCSTSPQSGSVGAALPGIELRLVDEAGRVLAGEDPGEIQVRGANLFSGYWPDGSGGPDAEGWWATGDVGFLDPIGRPVPRRPGQGARHRQRLQRLPDRGRGGAARGPRRPGRGRHRRRGRRDRRGRGRVRRRARTPTPAPWAPPWPSTPPYASPASSSPRASRSSTSCP